MTNNGWVKIHRKMIDWEWYTDTVTKIVFLHLLLTANHQDKKWHGIIIKRGQLVTGREALYNALNRNPKTGKLNRSASRVTAQCIRTALKRLILTNEITIETTPQYSVVTILKYGEYQETNQEPNQQLTNDQPTTNQQLTTNKNVKNIKNEKKIKKESIYNTLESINSLSIFQEIATNYRTTVDVVANSYDNLVNYCEANGRVYDNYRSALNNFVKGDLSKVNSFQGAKNARPNIAFINPE